MENVHRDLIREKYQELADEIKNAVDGVTSTLWSNKIISKHMEEDILEANSTKRKRAMALLDLIPTRGPKAFEALYEAVLKAELFAAADILKPNRAPHQVQIPRKEEIKNSTQSVPPNDENDSSDDELPDSWPSYSEDTSKVKLRKIENSDCKQVEMFKKSLTPKGQQSYYTMKHKPRGNVLVINQETFTNLEDRTGTLKDRAGIEKLFRDLGFTVNVLNNKTKEQMWEALVNESKTDHSNFDCFILFILSHGYKGAVFGTDGEHPKQGKLSNCIYLKDITDLFCRSTSLRHKPKIFFIQACQGTEKDSGFSAKDTVDSPLPSTETLPSTVGNSDVNNLAGGASPESVDIKETGGQENDFALNSALPSEESDAMGDKSPSFADAFVAMATTPGMLSWRNTKEGTWFIQAVIYILSKFSYKYDLHELMTKVNQLVSKAETSSGKFKQIGEKKDTFRKRFYFFPGMYE